MKLLLIAVGKTNTDYVSRGINDYLSRLSHYIPVATKIIADVRKSPTPQKQKELEGEAILATLLPSDRVILLDENGREYTSRQFAAYCERLQASGAKRVVFIVGGPYGFSPAVYERADGQVSLSKMTFNHEMVRLFFAEQLYRAQTILRGEPYHHD
ncbi:MAG: 23S rRNA (pseudouridine(1915)-N(3))-methyltransferase RlmH [Bacteroides sp.]|nr:23S rRNA (pseudouridine(1915)-N(3))-methyltransferase RlmH [Bacteroides sp.]MCM1378815.1 23S rRNA (pseudouridine(1915)-N(3))-methyltransferase RlmH [Bacteroides sp.]MCM1445432.1 23S rRNA (pseudouridine(1915)-N(3))-methyltransferase RlmH [Prevotella sp.]